MKSRLIKLLKECKDARATAHSVESKEKLAKIMKECLTKLKQIQLNEDAGLTWDGVSGSTCMYLNENASAADIAAAIGRVIQRNHMDLVSKYGLEQVMDSIREAALFYEGAEELGTSDVGAMVKSVIRDLESRLNEHGGGGKPRTPWQKFMEAPGAETLAHNQRTVASNEKAMGLAERGGIPGVKHWQSAMEDDDLEEGLGDAVKGLRRAIKGKPSADAVRRAHFSKALAAKASGNNAEKEFDNYMKVAKITNPKQARVAEEVDTGEYDARKSQPSSKEEQDKVFAKHKERMKNLDKEDVAEGTDGTADYTLGYPVDKEYVYTIWRNGEPDGGTYHSLEQAKRILSNMRKGSSHNLNQFKITRKPRSKMAGPRGVLPEGEYDPSYDPDYRPHQRREPDPDSWKQARDLEEPSTSTSTVTVKDLDGNVVLTFPSTGGYYGDVRIAKEKGFDTEAGDYDIQWNKAKVTESSRSYVSER